MPHHTKDKGDLAVAKTLAHLNRHQIRACIPLSEHLPFDLIAVPSNNRDLQRMQVKYRSITKQATVELAFRSNYYDSKKIYSVPVDLTHIDCYAIYCPQTDSVYYLRIDEIPESNVTIQLRLKPTQNGQKKGVRMAEEYVNPHRIIDNTQSPARSPSYRHVSPYDEYAISEVISNLLAQNIQPCIPISQYLPFDLIAVMPDMQTLYRLRVGYEGIS